MRGSKVEICGIDTSVLKTLSEAEKRRLLILTKSDNGEQRAAAREELILGNLRLVLSVIARFTPKKETGDDLFQVGCIGLIKAIDNFNLDLEVRFSTYAVPMIIGEIRRYQRDNNYLRVSRSVRDLAYRALQVKDEISLNQKREATLREIAAALEVTERELGEAMEAIIEPVSIFDSVFGEGDDAVYLIDKLSDEEDNDTVWVDNICLAEAIKKLSKREKSIIDKRFYKGQTQMEIADEIGISQAQVSRLEKSAIDRIKKQL
jgi:RNA polymerase sporulation-specific sigma factor